MQKLQVHSIFESISGEAGGFPQGTWCTFIRFQGCNLACNWCDTPDAKAKDAYVNYFPSGILPRASTKRVLITGGEPLMQRQGLIELISLLSEYEHIVQVETNGSYAIPVMVGPISWVIDYKCLSSGMAHKMRELDFLADNIHELREAGNHVHLKWVVGNRSDLLFALARMLKLRQIIAHPYLGPHIISPLNADGSWINEIVNEIKHACPILLDHIVFSVQLHKIVKMP